MAPFLLTESSKSSKCNASTTFNLSSSSANNNNSSANCQEQNASVSSVLPQFSVDNWLIQQQTQPQQQQQQQQVHSSMIMNPTLNAMLQMASFGDVGSNVTTNPAWLEIMAMTAAAAAATAVPEFYGGVFNATPTNINTDVIEGQLSNDGAGGTTSFQLQPQNYGTLPTFLFF